MSRLAGCLSGRLSSVRARSGRDPRASVRALMGALRSQGESGQVALLVLGFTVVTLLLVIGGIDVTAVQLARTRMMDAADGAALDAADSIDLPSAYAGGLTGTVALSDATVSSAAASYLARQPVPQGVTGWSLGPGTGSPDGHTAVVRVEGTAELPIIGPVVTSFGGSVNLSVESHARAVVQ